MKRFEISKPGNDKPDDNEQKDSRKKPRFLPVTHADQPSPSVVYEKEWMQLKGEKSAYSDRTLTPEFNQRLLTKTDGLTLSQKEDNRNKNQSSKLEDVINLKDQKRKVYSQLDSLLERSGQGTLEGSKSERGGTSETS